MCDVAPLTYVGDRSMYSPGNVHKFIRDCGIVLLSSNDVDNRWFDNWHLLLITCVLEAYDGMRVVVWDRNKRHILVHYRHPIFCKILALSDYVIVRGRRRNFKTMYNTFVHTLDKEYQKYYTWREQHTDVLCE